MNDHFGSFDLDFNGTGTGTTAYQRSGSTVIQQASHQPYAGRGPTMENYDPSRMVHHPLTMAAYNPTGAGTGNGALTTHRTLLPATPLGAPPATSNALQQHHHRHHQHHQQLLRGIQEFDPLPLSTAALHRMTHPSHIQHQQQQQQQHQHNSASASLAVARGRATAAVVDGSPTRLEEMLAAESSFLPPQQQQQQHHTKSSSSRQPQRTPTPKPKPKPPPEVWLQELILTISGLSLEPLTGNNVLDRVVSRSHQVTTRYLPCVDFLVQCQQELRKGLASATAKRVVHHMFRDAMTPRQFYQTYIANLPERFYRKNRRTMDAGDLDAAVKELQTLCTNAKGAERQGCESVKNTFLGGMKDGESWGLRKWLSKHGGALHICNDSECILNSCQKLDRSNDSTRKLGAKLRPLAKKALQRLKADVPASYQEHSTAHPYLPFFHRLEAALKAMSNFDPEDDDVICIDDDEEVEELKAQAPPPKKNDKKRKTANCAKPSKKRALSSTKPAESAMADDDSIIEILDNMKPSGDNDDVDIMQALLKTFDDDISHTELFGATDPDFDSITFPTGGKKDAFDLATGVDRIAAIFESNQASLVRPTNVAASGFWDEAQKYASVLRLFSEILRIPDSIAYLERVDETETTQTGETTYSNIIRHPLCFRDITAALLDETDDMHRNPSSNNGLLPSEGLDFWNMWQGCELLQAIDLVFLNSLAYGKAVEGGRSIERSRTNKLRKLFWTGIRKVIDKNVAGYDQEERKRCTPTRRGESSGFVVFKERTE